MVRLTAVRGGGGQWARKSGESDGIGEKRDKDEGEGVHGGGGCEGRSEEEAKRVGGR